MTMIKFRLGSNQPGSEVSNLKKLTVEQVLRKFFCILGGEEEYLLLAPLFSYT